MKHKKQQKETAREDNHLSSESRFPIMHFMYPCNNPEGRQYCPIY